MALLELISEEKEDLPEINGHWTWAIIITFRLVAPATSEAYLADMIAWAPKLHDHYLGDAHGPYRLDALSPNNYVSCSASDAETAFSIWISEFSGPNSRDPDRILSELIRPRLAGAELFLQSGVYDKYEELGGKEGKEDRRAFHDWYGRVLSASDPKLANAASILMGWIEVVAINREAKTLTMVVTSAD